MTARAHETLAALPHFHTANAEALDYMVSRIRRQQYQKDEILFMRGDPALGMWIVREGRVRIYRTRSDGAEKTLLIAGERMAFNEIAALDGGTCPANAAALVDSTLCILPTDAIERAMEIDPTLPRAIIKVTAGWVRRMVDQIEDLTLYGSSARLARFLLKQQHDSNLRGSGVTRQVIANYLGITPESLSRSLRDLENAGAIQYDRVQVTIKAEEVLREIAEA